MPGKPKRGVTCDPAAHKEHLCYLIAHRRVAKARALVGDGRYRCRICDRLAASPDNLCDPVERATRAQTAIP